MAKLTIEQVRTDIETEVVERLCELDDYVAERYEIECWDGCLDGAVWNKTLKTIVTMYVDAIVSDRDWNSKTFKQDIDITTALERKQLERDIKQLERKLKELA